MRSTGYPPHAACVLGIMAGPVSYDREYNERLGYGTDQVVVDIVLYCYCGA